MKFCKGYEDDAGIDIYLQRPASFLPKQFQWVDLGVSVSIPRGYLGLIQPRSSASMRGIMIANCPIDPGYTGNLHAMIFNCSNETINFKPGERICQLVVVKCEPNILGITPIKDGVRGNNCEGSTNV